MLITFPILSHPNKSFPIWKYPWWGISNMNWLVEHEQVRTKVVRSRLHVALCWFCLWRTAMGERQGVQISIVCCFILSVLSPVLRSRFWKGSVLTCFCKYNSRNLAVLRKLQNQALEAPCLRLAL